MPCPLQLYPIFNFVIRSYVNIISQTVSDIDLFDQQDLTAYASNAHHCMLRAVQELMLKLHQDPTTLNRQSKGFFGLN